MRWLMARVKTLECLVSHQKVASLSRFSLQKNACFRWEKMSKTQIGLLTSPLFMLRSSIGENHRIWPFTLSTEKNQKDRNQNTQVLWYLFDHRSILSPAEVLICVKGTAGSCSSSFGFGSCDIEKTVVFSIIAIWLVSIHPKNFNHWGFENKNKWTTSQWLIGRL